MANENLTTRFDKMSLDKQNESRSPHHSPVVTPLNPIMHAKLRAFQQNRSKQSPSDNTSPLESNSDDPRNKPLPSLPSDASNSEELPALMNQIRFQQQQIRHLQQQQAQQVQHQLHKTDSNEEVAKQNSLFQLMTPTNGAPPPLPNSVSPHILARLPSNPANATSPKPFELTHKGSIARRRGKDKELKMFDITGQSPSSESPLALSPGEPLLSQNNPLATSSSLITPESATATPSTMGNNGLPNNIKSSEELIRKISLRKTKPNLKLNLDDLPGSIPTSSQNSTSTPSTAHELSTDSYDQLAGDLPGTSSSSASITRNGSLSSTNKTLSLDNKPQLHGLFANYSKYVDIKSGSLNFAGKASLHSEGVDFLSGSSFRISLDELEFIEEIGHGNYGTVTKVLHRPTGVLMAMKEVRLELDETKFTQILMELEILHKCDSPYIVDFYGAFFIEGAVYMCMEYMDGSSLDKVYGKHGIRDEACLAYITECIIRGLKELKDEHNIIHRDVKPTNILVNSNGKVKLCDFGVSGNLVASLAKTNIGCQSYMAPERIKSLNPDASSYSVQSDVWSLGLTILEVACGHYPYPPETYNNIFSQLSAIVDGEPPSLDPKIFSNEARMFVKSCLNKKPNLRPSYAALLNHPWLLKYRGNQPPIAAYVQDSLREQELKKQKGELSRSNSMNGLIPSTAQAQIQSVSALLSNKVVKAPALHRGGLPKRA